MEPCGPFVFQNVTEIAGAQPIITILSSTAVAVASASMSGAVIQCSTSQVAQVSTQIGPRITLCILGKKHKVNQITHVLIQPNFYVGRQGLFIIHYSIFWHFEGVTS